MMRVCLTVEFVSYLNDLWKQLDRLPIFEDETGCGSQSVALFYWICIIQYKKETDLQKLFLKSVHLLRSSRLRMLCNKKHFIKACKTFEDYIDSITDETPTDTVDAT